MSTKSVSVVEPTPLGNTLVQNNVEARADIVRNLSGAAAWVVAYVVGGEDVGGDADTPNPVPPSPMHGLRGHTHSGGPDGKALFRTIASATLDDFGTYSANVQTQVEINNVATWNVRAAGTPIAAPDFDLGTGAGEYVPMGPSLAVWVPGCDPRNGAYVELGWRLHMDVRTTTNVAAGDDLTVRITNETNNSTAEDEITGLNSLTFTAAVTAASDQKLSVIPGRWNMLQLSGEFVADATAGVRTLEIAVCALELGVYET